MSLSSCIKMKLWSAVIGVIVSTMVFWKTVIFVWYDHDFATESAKNFSPGSILCYWLPNTLWLIFPLIAMYLIPKNIIDYSTRYSTEVIITPIKVKGN